MERQARIEASLREREREVQKARSEQTKEIDREREQHKREEAIQHFKALMSDMVRCIAAILLNSYSYITRFYKKNLQLAIDSGCSCLSSEPLQLNITAPTVTAGMIIIRVNSAVINFTL